MADPARSPSNRPALIIAPPVLLATTYLAFNGFVALFGFQWGYFLGFLFKWVFWCLIVPLWLVGPNGLRRMFRPTHPRVGRPAWLGWLLLVLPSTMATVAWGRTRGNVYPYATTSGAGLGHCR